MEHDDKVRNELHRLLDEVGSASNNRAARAAGGGTDAANESEFTGEDRKILRRMLIRV